MTLSALAVALGFLGGGLLIRAFVGDDTNTSSGAYARAVDTPNGKTYVIDEAHFRAAFPSAPTRQVQTVQDGGMTLTMTLYTVDRGEADWAVGVMEMPASIQADYQEGLEGAATGSGGSLISQSAATIDGLQGVRGVVFVPGTGYTGIAMVQSGDRLYQILLVGKENPPEGFEAFLSSFAIES